MADAGGNGLGTLGERLAYAMEMRGVTTRPLADAVSARVSRSVSYQTIVNTIRRKSNGSRYSADLARILGVNLQWLVTGTGEMDAQPSAPDAVVKRLESQLGQYVRAERVLIAAGLVTEEQVRAAHEMVEGSAS